MKTAILVASLAVGCGGGQKPNPPQPPAVVDDDDAEPTEAEPEEPPPPPRKTWRATAALTPVKGAKVKPMLVSFSQREGEDATVVADTLDGVKPGAYWFVIHEGTACGKNATKAGRPWPGGNDAQLKIQIAKDLTGGLDESDVKLVLDGAHGVGAVGHVLVLHEDKKGTPGKTLACGLIEAVDED